MSGRLHLFCLLLVIVLGPRAAMADLAQPASPETGTTPAWSLPPQGEGGAAGNDIGAASGGADDAGIDRRTGADAASSAPSCGLRGRWAKPRRAAPVRRPATAPLARVGAAPESESPVHVKRNPIGMRNVIGNSILDDG